MTLSLTKVGPGGVNLEYTTPPVKAVYQVIQTNFKMSEFTANPKPVL